MGILQQGKLNIGVIDSSWGSSGKGKVNDFLASQESLDFAITQNTHNASHIVQDDDGDSYKFNFLPSSVYYSAKAGKPIKVIAGADCSIQLPKALEEIRDMGLTPENLFIHPNMLVINEDNIKWEEENLGYLGSTMTGGGASKGMKVMRAPGKVTTADQVDELKPFIANTHVLANEWLSHGETGILETAQGFDLSIDNLYLSSNSSVRKCYPTTTSRNVNAMSFLGASFVPHIYIGSVIINFRSFPIRVGDNSNIDGDFIFKFSDGSEVPYKKDQEIEVHLDSPTKFQGSVAVSSTMFMTAEKFVEEHTKKNFTNVSIDGKSFSSIVKLGSSGGCYDDQKEISWDEVTAISGSETPVLEQTSLTKRIRRVFTPSKLQTSNSTMCTAPTHISINFVNYIDSKISGVKGKMTLKELGIKYPKVLAYIIDTARCVYKHKYSVGSPNFFLLGTGPKRSDVIEILDADSIFKYNIAGLDQNSIRPDITRYPSLYEYFNR